MCPRQVDWTEADALFDAEVLPVHAFERLSAAQLDAFFASFARFLMPAVLFEDHQEHARVKLSGSRGMHERACEPSQ